MCALAVAVAGEAVEALYDASARVGAVELAEDVAPEQARVQPGQRPLACRALAGRAWAAEAAHAVGSHQQRNLLDRSACRCR